MIREINLDMDGTIAGFYDVENWLDYLMQENVYPYVAARPLVNMSVLARYLNQLSRSGYVINIISWTSRGGSDEYNERVRQAKLRWLNQHLHSVHFDNIYIIPYGTPKESFGSGILFDDEQRNRDNWNGIAYDVENILEILRELI